MFRYYPDTCPNPACDNNSALCPDRVVCEPVPYYEFELMELIAISVFTAELFTRTVTVWAADSRFVVQ